MSLVETVLAQVTGPALGQIAQRLGVDPRTAQGAIGVAVPLLVKALSNNAQNGAGASSLLSALDRDHDGSILDDLIGFASGASGQGVNAAGMLGHILGGQKNAVEETLGQASGLGSAGAGTLLSILAPIVLGQLGRQHKTQGFDPSALAGALFGEQQKIEQHAPSAMDMLGQLLGGNASPAGSGQAPQAGPDLMALGGTLLQQFLKR